MDMYKNKRLSGVNDLVFDNDGGLYFTEPYGSDVLNPVGRVFYLPPGGNNATLELVSGGMAFPNGIALAPGDNNLYITESSQGVIWRVRTKSAGLLLFHQR